MFDSDDEKEII